MADGINKQVVLGNLGNDPESGYTGTGRPYCKFSVATTKSWKDKQTQEKQERTEWHHLVAFDKLAEICSQYLRKGSKIYGEGETQTSSWVDAQTQEKRSRKDVILNDLRMLDSQPANNAQQPHQAQQPQQPHQAQQPQQQRQPQQQMRQPATQQPPRSHPNGSQQSPYANQGQQAQAQQPQAAPPFDDDIPF